VIRRHCKIPFALAGFIIFFSAFSACACPEDLPTISIAVKGHRLLVEVAATPSARRCGLSHRESLPTGQGMLFAYPTSRQLIFWMKDTQIPLSIAFLDEKGLILRIHKMTPLALRRRYPSSFPARYALEVKQGWFEDHDIDVGAPVELQIPESFDIY
jgi:uncharacterized membrane protein (UPF0127 family)